MKYLVCGCLIFFAMFVIAYSAYWIGREDGEESDWEKYRERIRELYDKGED